MTIGALLAELLAALAPVLGVLLLLLLLLQAARTPTQSAMALMAIAFVVITLLENQGSSALTPGSSFLYCFGIRQDRARPKRRRAHFRGLYRPTPPLAR